MLHFAFIFLCRSFSQVQSWGSFVTHVLLCQTFHQVLGINTEIAPKIYEGNNEQVMLRVFFHMKYSSSVSLNFVGANL